MKMMTARDSSKNIAAILRRSERGLTVKTHEKSDPTCCLITMYRASRFPLTR